MPAWGEMPRADAIWDPVAYVTSISSAPDTGWGQTISLSPPSPSTQQVPAELVTTTTPWARPQPFGNGASHSQSRGMDLLETAVRNARPF